MARERIATWPSDRASRLSLLPTETLTGDRTLSLDEIERYNAFAFDCNGAARNLVLPAEAACEGVYLLVRNATAATHVLTIQNDAAGTVEAVPAATGAAVWCDGTTWHALLGA